MLNASKILKYNYLFNTFLEVKEGHLSVFDKKSKLPKNKPIHVFGKCPMCHYTELDVKTHCKKSHSIIVKSCFNCCTFVENYNEHIKQCFENDLEDV
jgi:hypothetical protein